MRIMPGLRRTTLTSLSVWSGIVPTLSVAAAETEPEVVSAGCMIVGCAVAGDATAAEASMPIMPANKWFLFMYDVALFSLIDVIEWFLLSNGQSRNQSRSTRNWCRYALGGAFHSTVYADGAWVGINDGMKERRPAIGITAA